MQVSASSTVSQLLIHVERPRSTATSTTHNADSLTQYMQMPATSDETASIAAWPDLEELLSD